MAELRLGLAGCGRLAELGYASALRRAVDVRLVAVADPDRGRRERLAAGLPGYPDAASMLDSIPLDGLVLATPCRLHLADARLAVERGVPALVEKPPAPDAAGARALCELHPAPYTGFNRRFETGVAEVREAIERVRPHAVELEMKLRYRRAGWAAHTVADDALLDLGPHLVDLACWLSGGEVLAVGAVRLTAKAAELQLELSEGDLVRIALATDRSHRERIVVRAVERGGATAGSRVGSGGTLASRIGSGGALASRLGSDGALTSRVPLRRRRSRTVAHRRSGGPVAGARAIAARRLGRKGEHALVASLTAQLEAFARAIHGEPCAPLATAADGLAVMAAIDAARASARAGGEWISVAPASEPDVDHRIGGERQAHRDRSGEAASPQAR